ncbi:protein containing DNA polymerase II large subunit DP2, partial [mine drainage metagenome]
KRLEPHIKKILSVGDILVTYGDFKKTNTPLSPTSYVEEYWELQLKASGFDGKPVVESFNDALELSKRYGVPMHPRYIYDYSDINTEDMLSLVETVNEAFFNGADTLEKLGKDNNKRGEHKESEGA